MTGPRWTADAGTYGRTAAYVPRLTDGLLALLGPVEGLRVLDLGCGDGTFTARLVAAGADVLGVDADPTMVTATRDRGIPAVRADAPALDDVEGPFDVVVSNAVLHWVGDAGAVAARVAALLRPGGRFVAEAGGHGNVAAVRVALRVALDEHGHEHVAVPSWWFPTPDEQRAALVAGGLEVDTVALVGRPTTLPGEITAWLTTFCGAALGELGDDRERVLDRTAALLAPVLRSPDGAWTADYVRIRFAAHRPG